MYIEELHNRLVDVARQRVRSGELTERGLARVCGLSQPHMHNVLKNVRALSTDSADRLMQALNVSVMELIWRVPGEFEIAVRAVPFARHPIGPGHDCSLAAFGGYIPFRASLVRELTNPVSARLTRDLVLPCPLAANDLVLLDQSEVVRGRPSGNDCWVVATGSGLRIRYVKWGAARVYLADESTVKERGEWQSIALKGRDILEIVKARVVWFSREMQTSPVAPEPVALEPV